MQSFTIIVTNSIAIAEPSLLHLKKRSCQPQFAVEDCSIELDLGVCQFPPEVEADGDDCDHPLGVQFQHSWLRLTDHVPFSPRVHSSGK